VVAPAGKGEVVMFATNPVWRWQNVGEYRMVFNTLMNFRNLAPAAATTTPPASEKNAGVPAAMQ
jgi:uncharacterized membrane protein